MIKFAYKEVPYYHRLFKELKISAENISSVEDFEKLPILTKDIINDNWNDFKPVNLKEMKYFNNSTGGTTGTPLNYRLTNFDRFLGAALLYQGWGYAGYELADKMVFLGAAALNINIETGLDKRLNEYLRNIRKLSSFDMVIVELKYRRIINTFKPKFIRGYASSLSFFANWLSENNITIHSPVATFTTSDQLFPNMREKIKSTFSCPVYDGYGLNDGGVKAFECEEHNGYHIDMERSIMEIVPRARRIKKK